MFLNYTIVVIIIYTNIIVHFKYKIYMHNDVYIRSKIENEFIGTV